MKKNNILYIVALMLVLTSILISGVFSSIVKNTLDKKIDNSWKLHGENSDNYFISQLKAELQTECIAYKYKTSSKSRCGEICYSWETCNKLFGDVDGIPFEKSTTEPCFSEENCIKKCLQDKIPDMIESQEKICIKERYVRNLE